MKQEADAYCEKILMTLFINNEKIRFNDLDRKLTKLGAKMSKPTLVEHLKHLVENQTIQRHQENKQKVFFQINWKRFQQLQKAKEISQITLNQKRFKSKSLDQQTIYTTAMLTIGELFYLRLNILNILEPENKLQNYFSYTIIRKLFNLYATWLYDSCKESKENSQKVLASIDKSIKVLNESFFEHHQKNNDPTQTAVPDKAHTRR